MLFEVEYLGKIYGVYSVTNEGNEFDKFLLFDSVDEKFKWIYVKNCKLVNKQ